jgi:hypothetical protein
MLLMPETLAYSFLKTSTPEGVSIQIKPQNERHRVQLRR